MKPRSILILILVAISLLALAACQTAATPAPTPTAEPTQSSASVSRLRIINAGSEPIKNLTLLFPDEEIFFGDVAAGATTEYVDVNNGVYGYAAYRYELDGSEVTQPVIDWVGEEGKQGWFTYTIDFDPTRAAMQRIMQQSVTQDQ